MNAKFLVLEKSIATNDYEYVDKPACHTDTGFTDSDFNPRKRYRTVDGQV